jgi:hypothetical protein
MPVPIPDCSWPFQAMIHNVPYITFPSSLDLAQKINLYDRISFAMILVAELEKMEAWKHCLARFAVYFFEDDIESLVDTLLNSNDTEALFKRLKAVDEAHFKKSLWQAQLEIFFPLIENQRVSLVEKYYTPIKQALERHERLYLGGRIVEPLDAELGLLVYLSNKFFQNSDRLICFSQADYSILADLHEYRNKLAHRNHLELYEMDQLSETTQTLGLSVS